MQHRPHYGSFLSSSNLFGDRPNWETWIERYLNSKSQPAASESRDDTFFAIPVPLPRSRFCSTLPRDKHMIIIEEDPTRS
jgi:hypothetical protein